MTARIILLMSLALVFVVPAAAQYCSPEYSGEQCLQSGGTENADTGGGGLGAPSCPYYMCANAVPGNQDGDGWCEATQSYVSCPIFYCQYRPCAGSNCYTTWQICSDCSSRQGNNLHLSDCPRR
jgi:hypothetical protein